VCGSICAVSASASGSMVLRSATGTPSSRQRRAAARVLDVTRRAFFGGIGRDGVPAPAQIFAMPLDGGEAYQLTSLPKGVGAVAWSPDGRTIALTTTTNAGDLKEPADPAKHESDVRVITRAAYRLNGPGDFDPARPTHIWTIAVSDAAESSSPKPLTSGDFDEEEPVWAPDASMIYFRSDRTKESYYLPADSDVYGVRVAGGEPVRIASIDGLIERPSPSPDGRNIAFIGWLNRTPPRSYDQPDLFIAGTAGGAVPRNLTDGYDFDIGDLLAGDQHAPRGAAPPRILWNPDGRSLIVAGAEQGSTNLKRVEAATGKVTSLTNASQEIVSYSMSANGTRLAALISTPTSIGDLFMIDVSTGKQTQITHVNDDLFKQIRQSGPEEFWFSSFDGKKVQGWILKPPDFDPSRKYPAILQIHGGPHSAYGNTFTHEFSWMAAKGYVVIYTNPRGSTTYGQDFGNIIQFHYPGDDFKDLMAAVDEVVKRGFVDERRMGVAGGSGGGVLTNWTIGHTTRFAAAVSLRSIADWTGFWYTADFTQFQPFWFRGAPWEDPADFAARSPITYVTQITTPLMLIEGEADMRTPPADGGEQMFRALKYLRKPVVMVRFPEETHELSRSGKPSHRVDRLRHMVGWFDKYLQGVSTPIYDVR